MSKIFLRDFGEVCHRRFDAEYYKDEFVELEQIIRNKTNLKLSDFILSISSGATPDKKESWKYYTEDKTRGIPFLRVQNIKSDTTIADDFIYINCETHEGILKRSQVFEDDLIITITGRLGTAAVAPKGFVGNINQHSVVIKTKNLETSRAIATFLNTSIGEKLAVRRATGGTRPALDYKALKSIPIVYNKQIYSIIEKANQQSKAKEQQAKELLDSIDKYLLDELGIVMPPKSNNTLENRIFTQNFRDISNTRFDPSYHQKYYQDLEKTLENGKYELVRLRDIGCLTNGSLILDYLYVKESSRAYIRIGDLSFNQGINTDTMVYINDSFKNKAETIVYENDIIFATIGATIGKVNKVTANFNNSFISNNTSRFRLFDSYTNSKFCELFFQSSIFQKLIKRNTTITAQPKITNNDILNLKIPLPPLAVQEQIASEINKRKERAKTLQQEAKAILESAKKQVESIILGG